MAEAREAAGQAPGIDPETKLTPRFTSRGERID
jgi:hypothetical protein